MRTILITGIGGLTPRSIATIIKDNHPDFRLIGCDVEKKAMGFFMKAHNGQKLIDKYYVAPRSDVKQIMLDSEEAFEKPAGIVGEGDSYKLISLPSLKYLRCIQEYLEEAA